MSQEDQSHIDQILSRLDTAGRWTWGIVVISFAIAMWAATQQASILSLERTVDKLSASVVESQKDIRQIELELARLTARAAPKTAQVEPK